MFVYLPFPYISFHCLCTNRMRIQLECRVAEQCYLSCKDLNVARSIRKTLDRFMKVRVFVDLT